MLKNKQILLFGFLSQENKSPVQNLLGEWC